MPVIFVFLGHRYTSLDSRFMEITDTMLGQWLAALPGRLIEIALTALTALLVMWIGSKLVRRGQDWAERAIRRTQPHDSDLLVMAIRRIIYVGGLSLTVAVALGLLGVNVGALIAGLGLTTVALGFALKDTLEQAVTGIFLLFMRPFKVGDVIEVEGIEGTVEEIAIRSTNIRTFDGLHVLIPNNRVFQGIIRNKSHYTSRRWTITLGIAYDSDLPKAYRTIIEAMRSIPGILPDPAPSVAFEGFDSSSIRAVVRYWIEPSHTDPLVMQTTVVRTIVDAARSGGIEVPYPVQTLVIKQPDALPNATENGLTNPGGATKQDGSSSRTSSRAG